LPVRVATSFRVRLEAAMKVKGSWTVIVDIAAIVRWLVFLTAWLCTYT
jgi:hypothetical protein